MLPLLGLAALFALPALADVEPADAAPFVGRYQIAFPDGEDVIVNVPQVSCDNPAIIEAVDEDTIHVRTPGGDMGNWDVKAFDGRFPWWREDGATLVTDWVRDDAFLLAGKDASGIRSDWARAKQWTRCPALTE
ncbi:hypothetical protein K1X12_05720 [Hyphomonas sp. WL0036]|uniref:hypothetical protein n=1 Tax=Hyphomonas sediminis TaxID=2866160 RepID=UPI001C7F014A|nr:hypothetical protein [Hyphomonas sediminis]MBY9066386.1 hypothetical protein [Hyphomonas sediminis]